jgi:hypothetical protein
MKLTLISIKKRFEMGIDKKNVLKYYIIITVDVELWSASAV